MNYWFISFLFSYLLVLVNKLLRQKFFAAPILGIEDMEVDEIEIELPQLAPELWSLIFSLLPFDDQLNLRLVCRYFSDIVANLPDLQRKLSLNLDMAALLANEPPLIVFRDTNLKYTRFNIYQSRQLMHVSKCPKFIYSFLKQTGETLTYLNISDITSKSNGLFCYIVKNLYLFKVLNHFKISRYSDWLDVALENETDDISKSCNTSVTMLSMRLPKDNLIMSVPDFEKIMKLLPNLLEFKLNQYLDGMNINNFPERYLEKMVKYTFTDPRECDALLEMLNVSSLPNIKHIDLLSNPFISGSYYTDRQIHALIERFPKLCGITSIKPRKLPEDHFVMYTAMELNSFDDLTNLRLFRNLKSIQLSLIMSNYSCFLNHDQRFTMESVEEFSVFYIDFSYCRRCFITLLLSFSNLKKLSLEGTVPDSDVLPIVFECIPNLQELLIMWPKSIFEPAGQVSIITNVKKLTLYFEEYKGSKSGWSRFLKALVNVKYLRILGKNSRQKIAPFKDKLGSIMPRLQRALIDKELIFFNNERTSKCVDISQFYVDLSRRND